MKPAPFAWHGPRTLDEALALLDEHGMEAKPLAGGQSLIPAMNFRLARPAVLVDLNGVAGLDTVSAADDGGVRLGAMTRQRTLERHALLVERAPLVVETMPSVAHVPIRNRGTLGGSLAHADPAAELPAVMVALDARFRLRSRRGVRSIPASEFFLGLFFTALEPGELLVGVDLPPLPPGSGWSFLEVARRHGDYALAGVACRVRLDADGRCRDARIVLMGVGEGPVVASRAAAALDGEPPHPAVFEAAAAMVREAVDPPEDIHASADYRRHLAGVLTRRALARAAARMAQGSASADPPGGGR